MPLVFGMQLVEVVRQACGVVFADGKYHRLARAFLLTRRQFFVAFPGKAVKLLHHQAIACLVRPFAFELSRVVVFLVDICAFGYQ